MKNKLAGLQKDIKANKSERSSDNPDETQIIEANKKLKDMEAKVEQVEAQLRDLRAEFEDIASDDEGHSFAQAVDYGEQQILKVFRYGRPNLEEQQELQIELMQTSSFMLDFIKIFPPSQLFVKFISLEATKASSPNMSHVCFLSTSEGLFYLDIQSQEYNHVQIEGVPTQSGLSQTDILALQQLPGSGAVVCLLKSENLLQNSNVAESWIDKCEGFSMAVIDLQVKDQVDQAPMI